MIAAPRREGNGREGKGGKGRDRTGWDGKGGKGGEEGKEREERGREGKGSVGERDNITSGPVTRGILGSRYETLKAIPRV